jgi:hypothetical protein
VEGTAADTPFSACTDSDMEGCVQTWEKTITKVTLQLPTGHGISGLTFVIRNEDGERDFSGVVLRLEQLCCPKALLVALYSCL